MSDWIIPGFILLVIVSAMHTRTPVYDAFIEGAADGFKTAVRIMPPVIAMMVAIGVFRASGALEGIGYALKPVLQAIGVDEALLPLMLTRPLSGSATLGILADVYQQAGPDSLTGWIASAMVGSTETVFYTVALYFGAAKVTKGRYTIACALIATVAGLAFAVWASMLLFQG